MGSFAKEHSFETRQTESTRVRTKFPDRIPVICEKDERSDVPDIDKKKYLVPADLKVGQFVYVVRKRIKLPPEKAIFVFINGNFLPTTCACCFRVMSTGLTSCTYALQLRSCRRSTSDTRTRMASCTSPTAEKTPSESPYEIDALSAPRIVGSTYGVASMRL